MSKPSPRLSWRRRLVRLHLACILSTAHADPCCCAAAEPAAAPLSVTVDAVALHRSGAMNNPFVFDEASTPPREVVNTDQLGRDVGVGTRMTLSRAVEHGSWELGFWGIDGWSDSILLPDGQYLLHADASRQGPPSAGPVYLAYRSRLFTAEVNWKQSLEQEWLAPLIGFRWLRLGESFSFAGQFGENAATEFEGTYRTTNDLFGAQAGAEAQLFAPTERLSLSATGKAGVYLNDAAMSVNYASTGYDLAQSNQDDSIAFVGEILLTATYRISPSVALRGGYQLNWLEGAALAADQPASYVANPSNGYVNSDGSLFLNGGFGGLEITW